MSPSERAPTSPASNPSASPCDRHFLVGCRICTGHETATGAAKRIGAVLPGAPAAVLVARHPRRFMLHRKEDVHDFTGPGVVAYGVQWPDGRCSYRWNSSLATTVAADSIADVEAIHGHDGKTEVVWID